MEQRHDNHDANRTRMFKSTVADRILKRFRYEKHCIDNMARNRREDKFITIDGSPIY